MGKRSLPTILLRGIILLPHNEIRLEFENDSSKNIIDEAEMFHDNELLVVSGNDPLEEGVISDNLPKIGVISTIVHKIELPNGKVRVIIRGDARARICEYLNVNQKEETLESIVEEVEEEQVSDEEAGIRKLYHELEIYIRTIPYMSNSVLPMVSNLNSLSIMTDKIVPHMPLDYTRMFSFLKEFNPKKRMEMLLEDIYHEEEMFEIEKEIDNKVRNEMENSQREYLLREKIKYIKEELGDVSSKGEETDTIRNQIKELDAPARIKERLTKELNRYEGMNPASPEMNVQSNYIHWMLDLPWNHVSEEENNLEKVKEKLDASHSGLEQVKTRILEYLAVKQMKGNLSGPILCLVGPPGVGKTTLAHSIAESIHRKFVKISVGGVRDEAEIRGHRRTYVAASPGRIIAGLKKAGTSNPLFLIDEIDKMTRDYNGDPTSALLEVLDPEQNKYFVDHYIEEEYDLSNILFIATANDLENIPGPLKDRLEIVNLSSYTEYEKLEIAQSHLIPKICEEHGLEEKYFSIEESAILEIIQEYTKEAGVRELERCLATIVRKLVTKVVLKENLNFHVTKKDLKEYLGKPKYPESIKEKGGVGIVNGLAYTPFGGDTLPIEVNYYKGNGNLVLTGSLGDVMKESAQIALSYVKANASKFQIDYDKLSTYDIHIHVPEGAVPKEGPSAGIALTTALISAFTNTRIDSSVAMTGEITLRGSVLPIGGLKEKVLGAHRNHITTILLPKENQRDLEEIKEEVKKEMEFILVENYMDVWKFFQKKETRNK